MSEPLAISIISHIRRAYSIIRRMLTHTFLFCEEKTHSYCMFQVMFYLGCFGVDTISSSRICVIFEKAERRKISFSCTSSFKPTLWD